MLPIKLSRIVTKVVLVAGVTMVIALLGHWFELDDRAYYMWMNWKTSEISKKDAIWLPSYKADVQAMPIVGVDKNLSGITFDYDSNTLWIVTNQPQQLIELDMDLKPIRKITLENFIDTEAVAYIGNNTFAIADERDFSIVLATIDTQTTVLNRKKLKYITLKQGGSENTGLEGIAIDPKTKVIYAVQERKPLKLISVSGLVNGKQGLEIGIPPHIDINALNLDDLSGLHFDSKTGHLLLLSDEAKLLVEVDMHGHKVSYLDLEAGFNGLTDDIPQAEGVTLDADGNLYIVSEPNLIYRFIKSSHNYSTSH